MTLMNAVFVRLIDRYLGGLLDPFIRLLEVHKLMYFMQEAGEPLRLRYVPAAYGPYAENLRHVLHAIEGHLISGYEDGGDDPQKELSLIPGALQDADVFLATHPETRARMVRVSELVDGFETPFGLELLSTVHWVATREGATNHSEAVARAYAWSDRKKQFSPRQIALAFDALEKKGWLDGGATERLS